MSPEECRRIGAECLMLAQSVANPGDKMLLLHLADAWRPPRRANRISIGTEGWATASVESAWPLEVPSGPGEFHPEPVVPSHEGCRLPLKFRAPPGLTQLAQVQRR
jgi:hypothetical protein